VRYGNVYPVLEAPAKTSEASKKKLTVAPVDDKKKKRKRVPSSSTAMAPKPASTATSKAPAKQQRPERRNLGRHLLTARRKRGRELFKRKLTLHNHPNNW
jgi:hypothetical protein